MLPPILFTILKSPLVHYVLIGAAALAWGYGQGKSDCAARHARQMAKEAQARAEKIQASNDEAYARGLQAARAEARNQAAAEAIGDARKKEPGGGDRCLSRDTLERLRQLGAL